MYAQSLMRSIIRN